MSLQLKTSTPILIFGKLDGAEGEVWLENTSGTDIKVDKADVTVTVNGVMEQGTIVFADETIADHSIKRLVFRFGLNPFVAPGTYPGQVVLATSAGPLHVDASLIVAQIFVLELAETSLVLAGVTSNTTHQAAVVAMNRGNVPVTVGQIPDETVFELATEPRVLTAEVGGNISVTPGPAVAPAGTVKFTNVKPTIGPGDWSLVTFEIETPSLNTDGHFRVMPRIATQRFVVDLLT